MHVASLQILCQLRKIGPLSYIQSFFVILCVCTLGLPSCLFFIGLGWNVYWASKKLLQIILGVFWKLGTNFNPIEGKVSVVEA